MIVFCTTCKGRAQHIEKTLPKNLADNPHSKFVLVDYNSQDHLLSYIQKNHQKELANGRLVVYSYKDAQVFHMTHAKNMAHRLGMLEGGTILVNLDADNFTGPGFADYIQKMFKEPNIFLWSKVVPGEGLRGCCGRIVVSDQAFLTAGGYNEVFDTYSPDDKDFSTRVQRLGWQERRIDKQYLATVPHGNKLRFREYPHVAALADNYEVFECFDEPTNTIANFGKIGCGTVYRNFSEEPIELAPLPTRIFGIGMHKTATSSLHKALTELGIKSAHWENGHWAKAVWNQMNSENRSLELERFYAASDLPITILYKKLDEAYPGSKFILTIRDEAKWLASVKKHWNPEFNKFQPAWKTDPFTNKLHRAVYGQKAFDADLFLAKYRQHNAEVLEYFKDRPDDLLLMDMSGRDGWPKLCKFLNKSIPEISYPREFVSR